MQNDLNILSLNLTSQPIVTTLPHRWTSSDRILLTSIAVFRPFSDSAKCRTENITCDHARKITGNKTVTFIIQSQEWTVNTLTCPG